jgi:hypothetical protein
MAQNVYDGQIIWLKNTCYTAMEPRQVLYGREALQPDHVIARKKKKHFLLLV